MHIVVNNILTTYTTTSSGPLSDKICLWLHGRQQTGNTFSNLIKDLPQYTHITLDLPGFGETSVPDNNWGVPDYADFVYSFIEKLGVKHEKIVILGHSFGGRIALELIGKNKIKPSHLVLIGSAGIEKNVTCNGSWYRQLITSIKKISNYLNMKEMYERIAKLFRSDDYNNAGGLSDIFLKTVNYNQTALLSQIHLPTLLIRGTQDDQTPIDHAHIMHSSIAGSELYTTDGGHFTYLTHSDDISGKINSFLEHHA